MVMAIMGSHKMIDDDLTPIHPRGGMIKIDEIEEVVISSDEENQNMDEMKDDD